MQKVFKNCNEMDKNCYESFGLTEDILMEHAAMGMERYIREHFEEGSSVLIVAGVGNNGADGIALARLLYDDYDVRLHVPFGVKSEMAVLQLKRAELLGVKETDTLEDAEVIVDALFGAGLKRSIDEETQHIVQRLNSFKGHKVACDVPTGVSASGTVLPIAFDANVTVTMGALKESLFLDESKDAVGKIVCVDLGVSRRRYEMATETFVLETEDIRLPGRTQGNTHKGSYGHAAVFTGEREGAGIIAATAAARYGAGLTTLVVHEYISPPPFLMHSTTVPKNTTAVAVGMGLGSYFDDDFLERSVIGSHVPVLLDADAFHSRKLLSILAQKEREIVITPHPKEFVSMWKILTSETLSVDEVQSKRFEMVRMFNASYPHVALLLKGANMLMMQEEKLYINPLGSARLSKGGSGDVLSGLIVSLLAQGYTAIESAIQGSLALTLAAEQYDGASYAMLSADLIEAVAKLELD